MISKKIVIFSLVALFICTPISQVKGADFENTNNSTEIVLKTTLTRGEAVSRIVQAFGLKNKYKTFLDDCMLHPDECFFVFSAQSDFDQITFTPLRLYPDVPLAYRYAEDIHVATMLELVHGYTNVEQTPFFPQKNITRIQALKIIMGAGEFIKWKERFELTDADININLPFKDIQADKEWWYPRYLEVALNKNIIDSSKFFYPHKHISFLEFENMLQRALKAYDSEVNSPRNSNQ